MRIRPAAPEEAPVLSRLARAAKAHWGYDAAQIARWDHELTVSPRSLQRAPSFVAENAQGILGFIQVDMDKAPPEIDHLWVDPARIGQGAGRALLRHAQALLAAEGVPEVAIDADPNAEGFYLAMGARRIGAVPAPIAGDGARMRPQLRLATTAILAGADRINPSHGRPTRG